MGEMSTSSYFRSGRMINNDPWAILIALASLIIAATIIAIMVVCILWRRYQKNKMFFEQSIIGISFEPPINNDFRRKEYEVQSLDMYVPQEDQAHELAEFHQHHVPGFSSPRDVLRPIPHLKEIHRVF